MDVEAAVRLNGKARLVVGLVVLYLIVQVASVIVLPRASAGQAGRVTRPAAYSYRLKNLLSRTATFACTAAAENARWQVQEQPVVQLRAGRSWIENPGEQWGLHRLPITSATCRVVAHPSRALLQALRDFGGLMVMTVETDKEGH